MAKTVRRKQPQFYLLATKRKDVRKGLLEALGDLSLEVGLSATGEGLYTADVIVLYIADKAHEQWGLETVNAIKAQPRLFLKPLLALSERHLEGFEDVVDEELILPVQPGSLESKDRKTPLHLPKGKWAYSRTRDVEWEHVVADITPPVSLYQGQLSAQTQEGRLFQPRIFIPPGAVTAEWFFRR